MTPAAILLATAKFALWEAACAAFSFAAARACLPASALESWLLFLSFEITVESTVAAVFSFSRSNSAPAYWLAAAALALAALAQRRRLQLPKLPPVRRWWPVPLAAAVALPLVLASFHPVREIDSVNYLHYLIEWMANRATPYSFATYYVAFWELSFLPTWIVTRVDLFFPVLALKSVAVLALAAWLAGGELGLRRWRLALAVAAGCVFAYLWSEPSGVPTLKNDALHGAGFVLLAIAVLRAARRPLTRADAAIFACGAAFAPVKYTGGFLLILVAALVLWLRRRDGRRLLPLAAVIAAFGLMTSWHYYVAHVLQYGNPFYPVRLNFGPIHLPGEADMSGTAILDSLSSPIVWRAFFLPPGGISPGGLAFPLLFAAVLIAAPLRCARAAWRLLRRREPPNALDYTALLLCCGWFLYFRSYYGASMLPGDLAYMRNGLNTLRYVDGVWPVSLLLLAALFPRLAPPLLAVQFAAGLAVLYAGIPAAVYSIAAVLLLALAAAAIFALPAALPAARRALAAAILAGIVLCSGGAFAVERNRPQWNAQWGDLLPTLDTLRPRGLATLTLIDAGYFAGQTAVAGNPVDPEVQSYLPEELAALHPAARPRSLAVLALADPTGPWRARYRQILARLGYTLKLSGSSGELYEIENRVPASGQR